MPTSGGPYYIYYFCCGTFTKLGSSPALTPQTSKSKGTAASDLLAFAISEDYLSSDHRASDAFPATSSESVAHALVSADTAVITVTIPSTALPGEFISGAWTSTQYSQEDDWIGIMRVGDVPQRSSALWWNYVPAPTLLHAVFITSAVTQTAEWITPSHGGPFVAYYFCCDSDAPLAQSNTLSLLVPVTAPTMPSVVTLPSHVLGRVYVTGSWYRPALSLGYDWVGLFRTAQNPVTDYPLWWAYVPGGGLSEANFSTSDNSEVRSWKTPAAGGSFIAVYFCCDSRTIEAKSNVMIVNGTAPATKPIYLPVVKSGGGLNLTVPKSILSGNFIVGQWISDKTSSTESGALDWIGLYHVGDHPGYVASMWWNLIPPGQTAGSFTTQDSSSHTAWSAVVNLTVLSPPNDGSGYYYSYTSASYYEYTYSTTAVAVSIPFTAEPLTAITGYWSSDTYSQEDDWIGILRVGDTPHRTSALWWDYVSYHGLLRGNFSSSDSKQSTPWVVPVSGGPFIAYYFCCDSDSTLGKSNRLVPLLP
eukprot:gene1769-2077_t